MLGLKGGLSRAGVQGRAQPSGTSWGQPALVELPEGFIDAFYALCRQYGIDAETAADEIALRLAIRRASQCRAWVRLQSGRCLNVLNVTPFDWEVSDLARGQATTDRWGGCSRFGRPFVDAQHVLLALAIARANHPNGLDPALEAAIVVHDGPESLSTLGDVLTPVKPVLGAGYRWLDNQCERAIHRRFQLPDVLPAEWTRILKRADKKSAATEAVNIVGWTREQVRSELKIPFKPLAEDPLAKKYGGKPWEPWEPDVAAQRFYDELEKIQRTRGLAI